MRNNEELYKELKIYTKTMGRHMGTKIKGVE